MSRTFTNLLTHVIFSTKDREPMIRDEIRAELHAYLGGLARELKGKAFSINGTNDHVHMLLSLPPNVSTSEALRFIKANSSAWVRRRWKRAFAWQLGYGAFSVSKSNAPHVVKYILNQESHHRQVTFMQEFLVFLHKHEIDHDERYIWK
jgi:REP element-mobilizing transposase RayT